MRGELHGFLDRFGAGLTDARGEPQQKAMVVELGPLAPLTGAMERRRLELHHGLGERVVRENALPPLVIREVQDCVMHRRLHAAVVAALQVVVPALWAWRL